MLHTGVIREVRGQVAVVCVDAAQCGSCSEKSTCYGLSGRKPGDRLIEAVNEAGASVGDRVEVEFRARASMAAISITFLLPVLLMGAGFAALNPRGAAAGAAGAAAGLLIGLAIAWYLNRRIGKRPGFGLTVTRVLE